MGLEAEGKYFANRAAINQAAKPWAGEIEARIVALEKQTNGMARDGAKIGGALAAWTPILSQVDSLTAQVDAAGEIGRSANVNALDAVTWSLVRPVSPAEDDSVAGADVPGNPDATWFVYVDVNGQRQVKEVWRWKPPTGVIGDLQGEWVQQRFGNDTLGQGAVDLSNLSESLSTDVTKAIRAKEELDKQVKQLDGRFQESLNQIKSEQAKIQGLVEGLKPGGRVITSATEPQGADRDESNLWVNTATSPAVLYRFDKGSNTWVRIGSNDNVSKLVELERKANEALREVQAAKDKATAAELAATNAQSVANGKNKIFYTRFKPSLSGRVDGDLWFNAADEYKMHRFDATARDFVLVDFRAKLSEGEKVKLDRRLRVSASKPTVADGRDTVVGGVWFVESNGRLAEAYKWTGSVWQPMRAGSEFIADGAFGAVSAADGFLSNLTAAHGKLGSANVGVLTADNIAVNSIGASRLNVADVQANVVRTARLDAGQVTSGFIGADRIAGRSITSAKLDVGDVQANVVRTARLDANQLTAGYIDAARLNVDSLRGKVIEGGVLRSGTPSTGITVSDRIEVRKNNVITNKLSSERGYEVINPNNNKLTPLSDMLFGAKRFAWKGDWYIYSPQTNVWFGEWRSFKLFEFKAVTNNLSYFWTVYYDLWVARKQTGLYDLYGGLVFNEKGTRNYIYTEDYDDGSLLSQARNLDEALKIEGISVKSSYFGTSDKFVANKTYECVMWLRLGNKNFSNNDYSRWDKNDYFNVTRLSVLTQPI